MGLIIYPCVDLSCTTIDVDGYFYKLCETNLLCREGLCSMVYRALSCFVTKDIRFLNKLEKQQLFWRKLYF